MNFFDKNLVVSTDSYKISHSGKSADGEQHKSGTFPEGTKFTSYYIEARTKDEDIVACGQNFIAKVLKRGVTKEHVERANTLFKMHFGYDILNYDGWMRIVDEFGGKLPVIYFSVPEGTVMKSQNVMSALESTHKDFAWLPGHLETFILRATWYPSTVATKSFNCKKVIKQYLDMTSDLTGASYDVVLNTRLHDFGSRGATSSESAAIGGLAHLYNFVGTDTIEALILAQDLYHVECAGFSIPAREHSTTVSYKNEDDAYRNSIKLYGKGFYSCVMDSTDYEAAVERVCLTMKDEIINAGGTFVFRPDSGDMIKNIMYTLDMLGKHFGYEYNSKGYKVLSKHVRIIQGDDINSADDILRVLSWMESSRWSSENIAFGMGGGLLQKVNRDTHKFAMKLSAIDIDGEYAGVSKRPKDAEWKKSKSGILRYCEVDGVVGTYDMMKLPRNCNRNPLMQVYFANGIIINSDTLQEIRDRIYSAI